MPFLMLGKVTFDKQVNGLERNCRGDISFTFLHNLNGSLSKINFPTSTQESADSTTESANSIV